MNRAINIILFGVAVMCIIRVLAARSRGMYEKLKAEGLADGEIRRFYYLLAMRSSDAEHMPDPSAVAVRSYNDKTLIFFCQLCNQYFSDESIHCIHFKTVPQYVKTLDTYQQAQYIRELEDLREGYAVATGIRTSLSRAHTIKIHHLILHPELH